MSMKFASASGTHAKFVPAIVIDTGVVAMFPPFERDELINLRQRAESLAEHVVPSWSRAYHALANAVDHLDAMIARTIVSVGPNAMDNRDRENDIDLKPDTVEVSGSSNGSLDAPQNDVTTKTPWTVTPKGDPTVEERITAIEKWIDYKQKMWNEEAAEAIERMKTEGRYRNA